MFFSKAQKKEDKKFKQSNDSALKLKFQASKCFFYFSSMMIFHRVSILYLKNTGLFSKSHYLVKKNRRIFKKAFYRENVVIYRA